MKKVIVSILLLVFIKASSFGQYSFGVSTGFTFNSASFGYKINKKLLTYVGFQYANVGVTTETSGKQYSNPTLALVDYSHKDITTVSLYLPTIGARYFLNEHNKIKSYVNLNFSKPIISGKQTDDGTVNDNFKDDIKNIKLWGGELGYGAEYYFDDNFSLGGEFGIRYIHFTIKSDSKNILYDPSLNQPTSVTNTSKSSIHVSPTYAKIVLNYYF
jgi:hypothetical protein